MAKKGAGRRTFLKTVALAGGAVTKAQAPPVQQPASSAGKARTGSSIEYPRSFAGPTLGTIAFPLGGIGTGTISLGGRGQLRDWEIFNKPDKGKTPRYAFAAIWAKAGSKKAVASVIESLRPPPYEGQSGLGVGNAPGLPRLDSNTFTGEYPLAHLDFQDATLPVKVSLEAFTPFIPLDAEDSGLPIAVLRYRVTNPGSSTARVSIVYSIDSPVGVEGRSNEHRQAEGIEGLLMRNPFLAANDPLAGSFALSLLEAGNGKVTWQAGWRGHSGWRGPIAFWDDFCADGALQPHEQVHDTIGSVCLQREIAPGASADYAFLLSWHFPNRTPERCGWKAAKGEEKTFIGNWYCTRFTDAWKVAEYAAANLPRLEKQTREFAAAIRETTLPAAVRDAATANLSTYATTTCFRTADGAFHAFEGSNGLLGCCFGNCTHVYNYEVATPQLFPTLSRSLRESAFEFCTSETGAQDFRQLLPANKERWGIVAADGQMGSILKLYLDWRLSGKDDWLRAHWPAAKRALEYAWIPGGWDADRDGVMEGVQHNTYDVEFYGPNPLCGVWYLAGLRAGEEMARAMGETQSADEYHRLFANGSKWIDANLFNGEYYIQKIRGVPKDSVPKEHFGGIGRTDTEHPDLQVGEGCLVDQLVGQFLAHVAGLGDLLEDAKIRKTLQSIMKYNFKSNLRRHESLQRTYALNDEAALIICDYGRAKRPDVPFPYFSETGWTGIEYSTAALMMYRGMIAEGLRVVEAVRRRFDGEKRNPWNEPECGHHYGRALAAWGSILALSGFLYNAPKKHLGAKPRVRPANFNSFWSTGTGWGVFSQVVRDGQQRFTLTVKAGSLSARRVSLLPVGSGSARTSATAGAGAIEHQVKRTDKDVTVTFATDVALAEGDRLVLVV